MSLRAFGILIRQIGIHVCPTFQCKCTHNFSYYTKILRCNTLI